MKFDSRKTFPHPVLRPNNDDYCSSDFQTNADWTIGKNKVQLSIIYALSSKEILEEVQKGNAEFVSVISCRDTFFSSIITGKDFSKQVEFQASNFRGEVAITPFIVIKKPIHNFYSHDFNPEYQTKSFALVPGDILAQDEPQVFYIDRELFKPVTSLFDLVAKQELDEKEWKLGWNQNHIQIQVSKNVKKHLDNARNNPNNKIILLNSIYFAAVLQAIVLLKYSPDDYEDYKWSDVIEKQILNNGLDLNKDDPYIIAQKLMQYPMPKLKKVMISEDTP
jgi:hypothetical protein